MIKSSEYFIFSISDISNCANIDTKYLFVFDFETVIFFIKLVSKTLSSE